MYDDPREPDERVARIKLILNWTETQQLILTNHNRRKVVGLSYGEMINHLGTGVLKKLDTLHSAAETMRFHLLGVIQKVSAQNKKEKQIKEQVKRRAESKKYSTKRKDDLVLQLKNLKPEPKRRNNAPWRCDTRRRKSKPSQNLPLSHSDRTPG